MTSQGPLKGTERHKKICGHCDKKWMEKGSNKQKNKSLFFRTVIFLSMILFRFKTVFS